MKKFILTLLYFFLPVIILSIPIDFLLSNKLKELNNFAEGENLVWNDIYKGKIDDEIYIYGSSRAWVHIDPQILEEELGRTAYNFGVDGQNFYIQNLRNQELMTYNPKPKYIIYSLDVFTLGKSSGLYNDIQFLPYMLMNDNLYDYLSSYKGYSYFDYYLPMLRYVGKGEVIKKALIHSISWQTSKPVRVKGYKGQKKVWNDDLKKAIKKIDVFEIQTDTSLVEKFNLFLDECKINNIEVIFVYTPEYIEGQNFVANRNEIITLYEEIAKKHDILFLNYSDDEINVQKKYFYNASHLNKTGAELFTNKLIKDLIRTNTQTGIYNKGSL
jgi:hypothetical protein